MQAFIAPYYKPLLWSLSLLLLGVVFYAGFLEGKSNNEQQVVLACSQNVLDKLSIPVGKLANPSNEALSDAVAMPAGSQYVGSKNGTKYYTPGCSGAKRISPANYIWFQTAEDAQIQGYTAGSC